MKNIAMMMTMMMMLMMLMMMMMHACMHACCGHDRRRHDADGDDGEQP